MRSFIPKLSVCCASTCAVVSGLPAAGHPLAVGFAEAANHTPSVLFPGWHERQKLLAADGAPYGWFGVDVVLSGDTALVGATEGLGPGSVYIFEKLNRTWTQTGKLTAADRSPEDMFGFSVALSGEIALIGAPADDDRGIASGSAYVFEKVNGEWLQAAKLNAADGSADNEFGHSVALSGTTAVVGARGANGRENASGSAYVFDKVNGVWTQTAKLAAADGAVGDSFGDSVAFYENLALIGARYDDDRGPESGSVYIFERVDGQWRETAKLTASDGAEGDFFGVSVAVIGNITLIGAWHDDDRGSNSGSAYVFDRINGAWTQAAKLIANDGAANDNFGVSVTLFGDSALVGAYGDDDHGTNSGSAYVFDRINEEWTQSAKLAASDGANIDYFGLSVALADETALIGAFRDDDRGIDSGSAYVFERISRCTGNERIAKAKCAGEPGSGVLKVQLAGGVPEDTFTVTLSTGPVKEGTLNGRGKGKAKFKRLPSGPGRATAEWGCGTTDQRDYACP